MPRRFEDLERRRRARVEEEIRLMEEAGARVLAEARREAFFGSGALEQRRQVEEVKQRAWRENVWGLWRRVGAWTAEQAIFLLAGYDPDRAEKVRAEFVASERRAFALHEAKVHALCAGLTPSRPPARRGMVQFPVKSLIDAAAVQDIAYAKDIQAFFRRMDDARKGPPPSVPARRRELVVKVAEALLAESVGEKRADGIRLPLSTPEFLAAARRLFPQESKALLSRGPDVLRDARLNRSDSTLPAVHLADGRPSKTRS